MSDLFRDDLNSSRGKHTANQTEPQPCAKYGIPAEKFILNYVARLDPITIEAVAKTKTRKLGQFLETEKIYYW